MKMDDKTLVSKMKKLPRFGTLPGVEISGRLLAAVGNPQRDLPFIHIAGTNGKGSTAAFLRSVLTEAGYRTGMLTSPELEAFTERFTVDGKEIPQEDFLRIGTWILEQKFEVEPTMSDFCLLLSVLYFREKKCDIAVFETGLGGRLDSTNALGVPLVAVLTKIGFDHTEILGSSLEQIAGEKAGILKPGCFGVSQSQEPEVEKVFRQYAKEQGIPLTVIEAAQILPEQEGFSYPGAGTFQLSMLGSYQRENALAAVLAAEKLKKQGFSISEEALRKGIFQAKWKGRMELLSSRPFFLADGAHNGAGTRALVESLKELYPGEKFRFIMGVLADKDYRKMVDLIVPIALHVTTVTLEHERALQGEQLSSYIRSRGIESQNCNNLKKAVSCSVCPSTGPTAVKTVAFGSLYFIGTVRKIVKSLV